LSSRICPQTFIDIAISLLSIPSAVSKAVPEYNPSGASSGIWAPHQRAWNLPLGTSTLKDTALPSQLVPPILKQVISDDFTRAELSEFFKSENFTFTFLSSESAAHTQICQT